MNNKTILIGIAGGTGSGKTSVAKGIASDFLKSGVAVIAQDSYYKDLSDLDFETRSAVNFDHPNSVDFSLMKSHLTALVKGDKVHVPIYDYTTHTRAKKTIPVGKNHIIIMEGILALFDQNIRDLMDIKLYIEVADDIRIIRRIKRDMNERERTFEAVIEQYYKTVRPMHIQFVEPTKKYAVIIIPEGGRNKVAIDILRTKLMTLI